MRRLLVCVFLFCVAGAELEFDELDEVAIPPVAAVETAAFEKFPGFPRSYEVEYILSLPYTSVFTPFPVKYPVRMWVDAENANATKTRIDTNGNNIVVTRPNIEYTVNPRMDELMCVISRPVIDEDSHDRGLPNDMTNWTFMGMGVYDEQPCEVYQLTETFYERTAYYTLYISLDGAPLYLSALGQNYFTGSHFDEYLAVFTYYKPGVPDASAFSIPEACTREAVYPNVWPEGRPLKAQMRRLIPRLAQGNAEYEAFLANHGRRHTSAKAYSERLRIFLRNKDHVERHNRRNDVSYTLELNRFADWTDEEFLAIQTGHLQETPEVKDFLKHRTEYFELTVDENDKTEIPSNFTWVGTPAVGVVKDQCNCGSCWAFAATETMQGAWYLATNQPASFSEQQISDCAWDYFNQACDGGFVSTAVLYAVNNGAATEYSYGYKGVDDFCNPEFKIHGVFSSVGRVRQNSPNLLRRAIMSKGPIGVSMDAGHLDFRFYKSGLFVQPECDPARTNHAVAVVGFGQMEDGHKYWLLKNSWSTFWGDKGYIKMDAEKHDCGVTSNPVYAVVDKKAVEAHRQTEFLPQ